ncbi:MAG TPA: MFS transporter [Pseudomonadales bacterium]|jgi:UMF1 family MFS transporter|nr:MFS transporter [Pseudomonadales bacterium]HMW15768.1 MFS transporter [Pseudomonadales bacterium]HMW84217.1 MFS transporter [Pseudomonadales bacterium]HMY97622.1 MFS transporter [Pseudomonadales bacterium]HMZ71618.1 MFS transporter [Pseudomonadales bacterium]
MSLLHATSRWLRSPVVAWALYDWANSAFALVVLTTFFPLFFKTHWNAGVPAELSTFRLGLTNSLTIALVVVSAPLLGALADTGSGKKPLLTLFLLIGLIGTLGLWWFDSGPWWVAALLFGLAYLGFATSNVFYDALLIDVSPPDRLEWNSALGFSLGYIGSSLLFMFDLLLIQDPQRFGLDSQSEAIRFGFLSVALWWGLFSLPLLWRVHERPLPARAAGPRIRQSLQALRATVRLLFRERTIGLFLLAYWLYIDGVDTVIAMAVDYGLAIGLEASDLLQAILLTQLVGFPAALLFGWLATRSGIRPALYIGLAVYMLVTLGGAWLNSAWQFYLLAVTIGLVQGGVQSLSRAYFARVIPAERSGELFGFYNMIGKFAAVLGPLLVGLTSWLSGSNRLGLLSLLLLFGSGLWLLTRLPVLPPPSGTLSND